MTNRVIRIVIILLLVMATGFAAGPYVSGWWLSATLPRTVSPRGDLTEAERTTIKLFQAVSPFGRCSLCAHESAGLFRART
jgi:hypothetical protein